MEIQKQSKFRFHVATAAITFVVTMVLFGVILSLAAFFYIFNGQGKCNNASTIQPSLVNKLFLPLPGELYVKVKNFQVTKSTNYEFKYGCRATISVDLTVAQLTNSTLSSTPALANPEEVEKIFKEISPSLKVTIYSSAKENTLGYEFNYDEDVREFVDDLIVDKVAESNWRLYNKYYRGEDTVKQNGKELVTMFVSQNKGASWKIEKVEMEML
jgi:hypothetical protein